MAEKKEKNKRRRRKAIVYVSSCICFGAPFAIFLLLTNLTPKATTPLIMCQNETGNCTDNSYKHNVGCYVNDTIIDSNGGSACTTKCIDSLTYKCNCPSKKIWEESVLTCSLKCLNETANCEIYTSGNHCIPVTNTNNGKDCKTNCNNSIGNFECSCDTSYRWDMKLLACVLLCQNETGNCTDNSYKHNVGCYVNDTIIDSNGGSACTTECIDSLTYKCNCPSNKIWEESALTCSLKCLNETANCEIYTSGNYCIPATDTNNGMDCKTICNNSIGSFECSCETNYQWDIKSQTCVLNCTNSLTMACTEITAVSVKCVDPIISENDDPNSLKLSDCIAYCPDNGTTLDYKCNCVKNYLWNSIDRTCVLECKLNTLDSCDEYPDQKTCMLLIPGENISSCTSICSNETKTDYQCTCLNELSWAKNDYKCLEKCPRRKSDCVETKTYGFPCSLTDFDPFSKNCIAECRNCFPMSTCQCIPNKYKIEIWDAINSRCEIACNKNLTDKDCVAPYTDGSFCNVPNGANQMLSCWTTCNADEGRSYNCKCFSGIPFDPLTNTCNNNCRVGSFNQLAYDECEDCSGAAKAGIDCNWSGVTCKTICQNGLINYNVSTCQ